MNGNKLLELRTKMKKNQEEFSKLFNIERSTYSRWETGRSSILLDKLIEISNTLNISIDYLCDLTNDKNIKNKHLRLDIKELGNKLLSVRKEMKLNQKELGKKLHISNASISDYEKGNVLIPTMFLKELSKISGHSMDWFCSNEKSELELDEKIISNNYPYNIIRKNIKKYREEKSLSIEELSKEINIDLEELKDIEKENNLKVFSISLVWRISEILKVDFYKFFKE